MSKVPEITALYEDLVRKVGQDPHGALWAAYIERRYGKKFVYPYVQMAAVDLLDVLAGFKVIETTPEGVPTIVNRS